MIGDACSPFRWLPAAVVLGVCVLAGSRAGALSDELVAEPATAVESADRVGNVFQTAPEPGLPHPSIVTIIADSGITGVKTYGNSDRLVHASWDIRMQSCRRLVYMSCEYHRTGRAPPTALEEIQQIERSGGARDEHHLLLIATGHNDWDTRLVSDLAAIMTAARAAGFEKVAWTLYRDNVDYPLAPLHQSLLARYGRMNQILLAEKASGRWPELVLLDYGGFTEPHRDWYIPDAIHLTPEGSARVADWLSWVILYTNTPELSPDFSSG